MKFSLPPEWESFSQLTLPHDLIEMEVSDEPGLYKGLDPLALYTSPEDLQILFQSPLCQGSWLDLGAGIGHTAILYGLLFPERQAWGVEKAPSRVSYGRKLLEELRLTNVGLLEGDLMTMQLPEADTCFLYFPTGPVLDRVLDQLKRCNFQVLMCIESHGDLIPRLQKESWLELAQTLPLRSQRHCDQAFIFRKKEVLQEEVGPHQYSYLDKVLIIQDKSGRWIGDSSGLEWLSQDKYQLQYPPRTIEWKQVVAISEPGEFPAEIQFLRALRRIGPLNFRCSEASHQGFLRKIQIEPSFKVEISTGEWLQWNEIESIHSGNHLCFDSSLGYFFSPHVL